MRLSGQLTSVSDIDRRRRDEMFALFDRYYEGVTFPEFQKDLEEKQWVIEVVDPADGTLRGFSTQCLLDVPLGGGRVLALFSGDTIVDRQYWGDPALSHIWGQLALSLIDAYTERPLYWYLISKGYRTYRFLPVFFRQFYPRHGLATPSSEVEILRALGRWKFRESYDEELGVVRPTGDSCRLRAGVGEVTPARMRDPEVRFFAERNPGYQMGHELCCLARLSRENFTPAAWRVIGSERISLGLAP